AAGAEYRRMAEHCSGERSTAAFVPNRGLCGGEKRRQCVAAGGNHRVGRGLCQGNGTCQTTADRVKWLLNRMLRRCGDEDTKEEYDCGREIGAHSASGAEARPLCGRRIQRGAEG